MFNNPLLIIILNRYYKFYSEPGWVGHNLIRQKNPAKPISDNTIDICDDSSWIYKSKVFPMLVYSKGSVLVALCIMKT